ncbi:MAG: ATP-dependent protease subunit HslV [Chloroflexi bacterium]|uniref:ATP-dependent protease subunit HslV n=1 Tax=Candidatus Chlorohelix allophototropha TaxID=3003348 RepID=A0A8T7M7N3_9CHLR|nr:ATP-dependent protease subunit HslV [Chloroflexota bacterium]
MQATTILAVVHNGQVAMAGDGQVTFGEMVLKNTARKIRTLYNGQVLAGFAGAVADALNLFEKFEGQLEQYHGNLRKAAVELTKEWRTDRMLRRLEAQLLVADKNTVLILSGDGDVVEPDEKIAAIGSGSSYALAAAKALLRNTDLDAAQIAERSLQIAGEMCIFTNTYITVKVAPPAESEEQGDSEEQEDEELSGSSYDGGNI